MEALAVQPPLAGNNQIRALQLNVQLDSVQDRLDP